MSEELKFPTPVAWVELTIGRKSIAHFDGKLVIMPGPVGNDCHPDPLYTADQVREMLASLRSELEAARGKVEGTQKLQRPPAAWKYKKPEWETWRYQEWSSHSFGEDADEYIRVPLYELPHP